MVESIKNMTMPLGERLAKIDSNLASVRLNKNKFFDLIKDAGFVTSDGSADVRAFNSAAAKAGIDVKDRSAGNMQKITKFLNKISSGGYTNVGMFSAKSLAENAASESQGFLGKYAEQYSAATKEEFWKDAKKIQRKVNKEKISSLDKVKKIARGLKIKYAVPIGVTTTLLSKLGFGKALSAVGGPPGMVAGMALDAPMLVDAAKTVKEDIIDPVVVEPAAKKMVEGENILKRMFTPNMNQGGMMNINEMIRPIGMAAGGPIPPEEPKKENKNGFGSLLMDFIRSEGMFAPSGKKFDTSDSPMFEDAKPIGLLDDAGDLRILSMKLVLKEAADSLKEMDRIDRLSPDEIIIEFESLMGKKGA
tara:strand:+ start:505 stop:1590 length:1086 start_codon:yes stop_codon:yes gene_type:complete